jgi:glycine hydroxymethyltransferase
MYTLSEDYFHEVELIDPETAYALQGERQRQQESLELNPGENYVSPAVLKALGSPMTNKYADGYPGRRAFVACENMDKVESLAIDRLKSIYGADHANVQSNCGGDTNMIVYYAMLQPGDIVLGPSLKQGGQMSHGNPRNFSGRFFGYIGYELDRQTEQLDYEAIRDLAVKYRPKLILSGSTSYPREIDYARFKEIADEAGSFYLADIAQFAGMIAGGQMNNPVPFADFVTASTHKTLRGPRGGFVLCRGDFAQMIDDAAWPGTQGSPQMHTIAAKAVCLKEAMQPEFIEYQKQVIANARALAAALKNGGIHIVSGGTDSHIVNLDVTKQGRTGNEMLKLLADCNIITVSYRLPFESLPEGQFGGLRTATSCLTTRGMREPEMRTLAGCILDAVNEGTGAVSKIRRRVAELTEAFPLYQI